MAEPEAALNRLMQEAGVLVRIEALRGSSPRGVGAWMLVFADGFEGSIGGGNAEWQALQHAREMLSGAGKRDCEQVRYALGPTLGQCCGGEIHLSLKVVGKADVPLLQELLKGESMPVAIFGAGHVGSALVKVLQSLPVQVLWVDSRDQMFPPNLPTSVQCEFSDPMHAAVKDVLPHSRVLIMSYSHAEDLEIVAASLQRSRGENDLPFIGLIGSKTKWASFQARLRERGFSEDEIGRVVCPVGVTGINDKRPEVIAVAIAAQLMQTLN